MAHQNEIMSFVMWIALGLAAGFVGGRLGKKNRESILPDVVLGLAGAVAGDWLYYVFGPPGVNGFHLVSLIAALIGSLVVLLFYNARRLF